MSSHEPHAAITLDKKEDAMSAVYRDAWRDTPEWKVPRWYHIGDRVRFAGMLLRCGVDHYAGDQAHHPWDPGWGWGDGAAHIWTVLTPEGMSAEADVARARSLRVRGSGFRVPSDPAAATDRCQCGHTKAMHPGFLGQPACAGTVDARPPGVGGDTLSPCQCKGFVAIIGLTNKVMTGGLDG